MTDWRCSHCGANGTIMFSLYYGDPPLCSRCWGERRDIRGRWRRWRLRLPR